MRSELVEETGYEISSVQRLFDVYMSPGSVTEYLALFLGVYNREDRAQAGGGNIDEGEDIETIHISLVDALGMIVSGDIRDAKTIILLQHLALIQKD
jgi:nudix-type nucleoside diphosphatase (YffH/AdpP family)